MEEVTGERQPSARNPHSALDLLPREWHEVYRKEVLPTLKCVGHLEVVKKARLRVAIKQNERAAVLDKLSHARVKAQMCGIAKKRRKREAVCDKLELREQTMQAALEELEAKAVLAEQRCTRAEEEEGARISPLFKRVAHQLRGRGRASSPLPPFSSPSSQARKRPLPCPSPFLAHLLPSDDLFSRLLTFLPSTASGVPALARCSRGLRRQVTRRLTHLTLYRLDDSLRLLPPRLLSLTSLDLSECWIDEDDVEFQHTLVQSGLTGRLQELRIMVFGRGLCSLQWARLTTLYTENLYLSPTVLATHQCLPMLSSLHIDGRKGDLSALRASMEAGSLPRLTRVECTWQVTGEGLGWGAMSTETADGRETEAREEGGVWDVLKIVRLAPRSRALHLSLSPLCGFREHFLSAHVSAFANLRELSLDVCVSMDLATMLPCLATHTPGLESLHLKGRPLTPLTLPACCWPRMHTLGLSLYHWGWGAGFPSSDFEALMAAAGPGLRTLDLWAEHRRGRAYGHGRGQCTSVLEILAALAQLAHSQAITCRPSLRRLLLPINPFNVARRLCTPYTLAVTLRDALTRLPSLCHLTCSPLGGALLAALVSVRATGGLLHLHTLTMNQPCGDDGMALLLVAWVRREAELYHESPGVKGEATYESCSGDSKGAGEGERQGDRRRSGGLEVHGSGPLDMRGKLRLMRRQSGVLRVEGMHCRGYALAELIEGMGLDYQLPGFNR